MIHYIASFIVYTFAMVGILIIAYVVYKKTVLLNPHKKNSLLQIVDMLRLPDRKLLYVIKCKDENFLIASSNDKVTLISKLNENKIETPQVYQNKPVFDLNEEEINLHLNEEKQENKQVIRSLLKELSDKNQAKRGNY